MLSQLRFAVRGLRRQPGFTLTALVTLALGIGATATIFSVVDAVLLRPLPYRDPGSLAVVLEGGTSPVSPANVTRWRAEARSFAGIGAAELWSTTLSVANEAERLTATKVTPDLFPLLGVTPALGRHFRPDEESSGARVVLLSDRLWRRRFGADPRIVGRPIRLSGEEYAVVGVMAAGFQFPPFWATSSDLWAPLPLRERASGQGQSLRAFARLAPGVTMAGAQAEIATIGARSEAESPGTSRDIRVVALEDRIVGGVRGALAALLVAVGFVLVIACTNVAHMQLARGQARRREIAVRAALGASRADIIRQLLGESMVLALGGGLLGVLLTVLGVRAVALLGPAGIPRLAAVMVDGPVLAFALGVSLFTAVAIGLSPALAASRVDLNATLGEVGRGGTGDRRQRRIRDLLIASEFALAVVLLVGAGLTIRSFIARIRINPGFEPAGVVTMVVSVTGAESAAPGRRAEFYQEVVQRIGRLPGVARVSAINHLPIAGDLWRSQYLPEGAPRPAAGQAPRAAYRVVLPGYFATMRLPLVSGRDFTEQDAAGRPPVTIVNRALARRHWPGTDPVGRRINIGDLDAPVWATIVGVSEDAVLDDWTGRPDAEFYLPLLQSRPHLEEPGAAFSYLTLVVRAARGDPVSLIEPIRRLVRDLDRDVPVSEAATMAQVVARANAMPRFYLVLFGGFASIALVLASVGIYGVTAYAVARRTRELGIRLALGASRAGIVRMVVGRAGGAALAGALGGVVAAIGLGRFMTPLLYGVGPTDPVTMTVVPAGLAVVAVLGALLPGLRGSRIDALRATGDAPES